MAQGAEPPQYGGDEPAHQRAVAVGKRGEAGMGGFAGQLFVERDFPPQDTVENVGGNPSGGEAGDFRLRGGARSRHVRIIANELWLGREPYRKNLTDTQVKPPGRASYGGIITDILL